MAQFKEGHYYYREAMCNGARHPVKVIRRTAKMVTIYDTIFCSTERAKIRSSVMCDGSIWERLYLGYSFVDADEEC